MNHPRPDEWVPYLYGESSQEVRHELRAHLETCAQCRELMAGWRANLKRLEGWRLPQTRKASGLGLPILRWAVAGFALLLAGFTIGRLTGPQADTERVRARLEPELRKQLTGELVNLVRNQVNEAAESMLSAASRQTDTVTSRYVRGLQAQRAEDRHEVETTLARLDAQRLADLTALKREIDTLAVNTDAGLRQTTAGLVELAGYRASQQNVSSKDNSTQ